MLNRIHARFASLALLVAAAAFVFSACDSGNGVSPGEVNTGVEDTLQISSMTPSLGADVDEAQPTVQLKFSQAIVENEYTADTVSQRDSDVGANPASPADDGVGNRRLVDGIRLVPDQAKDLTPSNSIPVNIEWEEDRTRLDITPTEDLQDGYIYTLSLGQEDPTLTGVYDKRFKSQSGDTFNNLVSNPEYDASALSFSVGLDESAPGVPDVIFEDQGSAPNQVAGETIAEAGNLDYTDNTIVAELAINNVDDVDGSEIKGYEVYYRTQNQTDRNGAGDQFVKATDAQLSNTTDQFEDSAGIIPASSVADDGENFDDDELEFTVTLSNTPLANADGTYGPIEWKVRAVSINGVRGDFREITTEDNEDPDVQPASSSSDSVDDVITLEFDEALSSSTATNTANYSLNEDSGTGPALSISGISIDNDVAGDATVTIQTAEFDGVDEPIEVTLDNSIQDLQGNSLDLDADNDDDIEIDVN